MDRSPDGRPVTGPWLPFQATIDRHPFRDHLLDLGLRVARLPQDLDALLPELGPGIPAAPHAARPLVREPHVARLAFGGVVSQLEEPDVLQMRVVEDAVERVIRHGGYVDPVEDLYPLGGGFLLQRLQADLEILAHVRETR